MKLLNLSPELYDRFGQTFKAGPKQFCDNLMSATSGKFCFDPIAFNEYMEKRHGYDIEKHGSITDFVKNEFGPEANGVLDQVINLMD